MKISSIGDSLKQFDDDLKDKTWRWDKIKQDNPLVYDDLKQFYSSNESDLSWEELEEKAKSHRNIES